MITTYRVKIDSCNGCHSHDHVVEFKIEPHGPGGQLIRFCYACRAVLRNALDAILREDARDRDLPCPAFDQLIERSSIGRGFANIREHGIDAELADLASTRKPVPSIRKKARVTRNQARISTKKRDRPKAR